MEENQFSRTALITACIRAYHSAHDDPKIFDDFIAHRLITGEECKSYGLNILELLDRGAPAPKGESAGQASAYRWWVKVIAGTIIARAKYAEDLLEKAVRRGIEQYVILGAGMDTFAFRRPELLERLKLFEVDHPATQAFKRKRLAQIGLEPPDSLSFVPIDFVEENLSTALMNSPYDPKRPAFFTWQGVTYYLLRRDVIETFRSIAQIARPGSGIAFDYLDKGFFAPENPHQSVHLVLENVRKVGEPMKTGFEPAALSEELEGLGVHIVEDLSAAQIESRFFAERKDGYHAGHYIHFAYAEIA